MASASGDPQLIGFSGQHFHFSGANGRWYALLRDPTTAHHVNMHVSAPLSDVPEITYITGVAIIAPDMHGDLHSIMVAVNDVEDFSTSCGPQGSICLGNGALTVVLDGREMIKPGEYELGPGLALATANVPVECSSHGGVEVPEVPKTQGTLSSPPGVTAVKRRLLREEDLVALIPMEDWILEDPDITTFPECQDYVMRATSGDSLFSYQSPHVSFQIVTPSLSLRISHGLHNHPLALDLAAGSGSDIPGHTTYEMDLELGMFGYGKSPAGILGETVAPTRDGEGNAIMSGIGSVRGSEKEYEVEGPLHTDFAMLHVLT